MQEDEREGKCESIYWATTVCCSSWSWRRFKMLVSCKERPYSSGTIISLLSITFPFSFASNHSTFPTQHVWMEIWHLYDKIHPRIQLGQSLLLLRTLRAFCVDCTSYKSYAQNHRELLSAAVCPGTQRSSVLCLKPGIHQKTEQDNQLLQPFPPHNNSGGISRSSTYREEKRASARTEGWLRDLQTRHRLPTQIPRQCPLLHTCTRYR